MIFAVRPVRLRVQEIVAADAKISYVPRSTVPLHWQYLSDATPIRIVQNRF